MISLAFFAVKFSFFFEKNKMKIIALVAVSHKTNNLRVDLLFLKFMRENVTIYFAFDREETLFNEPKKTSC